MFRFLLTVLLCVFGFRSVVRGGEVYFTDFSNFTTGFDKIAGTDGWTGSASHAGLKLSGVDAETTHGILGIGNAAFIGGNTAVLAAALNTTSGRTVNVRRAINKDPVALGQEVVLFYVNLGIKDSSTTVPVRRDNFEFAFYNQSGQLLAFLQFDNSTIDSATGYPSNRILRSVASGTTFTKVDTGSTFFYNLLMGLQVRINFRTNRWSASLDDVDLFSDEVFYGGTLTRNLGVVAAQMQITGTGVTSGFPVQTGPAPGDNYMLFDDFGIRTDPVPAPEVLRFERSAAGAAKLTWLTEALYRYQVQYTDDFAQAWKSDLPGSLMTATGTGESTLFTDTAAAGKNRRFYRVVRTYP